MHGNRISSMGADYNPPGSIIEKYIWKDKEILHIKDNGNLIPDIEHVDITYEGQWKQ